MRKILFIEICNYDDYPLGGHLTFAKHLLLAFKDQLALVGCTTDNTPVGKWVKKTINGIEYDFFSVKKIKAVSFKKTLIPLRIKSYFNVLKYRKKIFSRGEENVLIQTPEVLFATKRYWRKKNLALFLPGVENPLKIARYSYLRFLAKIYDKYFFQTLQRINIIFACADNDAINEFCKRSNGKILPQKVISFPTRIDPSIFYKTNSKDELRKSLGIGSPIVIVTSGRLHKGKGWDLLINSFVFFERKHPDSHLYFLGDGSDKEEILNYIDSKHLNNKITLVGNVDQKKLGDYLRIADIFVMGSVAEGWSTSLVEAVASGVASCVTNFSSATTLIKNGFNGYVSTNRNDEDFSMLMDKCLSISDENLTKSADNAQIYSIFRMKADVLKHWTLS